MTVPTPLIHYSDKPIVEPRSTADPGIWGLPKGLWVSVGDAWLIDQYQRWLDDRANPDLIGGSAHYPRWFKYANEITISDASGIMVITNESEFRAFSDEYSERRVILDRQSRLIKWRDVSMRYQGIIIAPHLKNLAHRISEKGNPVPIPESVWYYTWLVASGCLWDVSVIENIKTSLVTLPPF